MLVNRFDKEINLINDVRYMNRGSICLLPESVKTKRIVKDIIYDDKWNENWIDNSDDTNNPPDFYSDKLSIMLEVMRVTDKEVKRGKNPTLAKENEMLKELEEFKITEVFPNVSEDNIFVIADSGLPSDKDHNFKAYKRQFKRTVEKHAKNVSIYKENHKNIKRTVFLIYDDSTGYVTPNERKEKDASGDAMKASSENIQFWFFDEYFVNIIRNSNADFVIWYTPYKHNISFRAKKLGDDKTTELYMPKVVIFDCNSTKDKNKVKSYDEDKMVSLEK